MPANTRTSTNSTTTPITIPGHGYDDCPATNAQPRMSATAWATGTNNGGRCVQVRRGDCMIGILVGSRIMYGKQEAPLLASVWSGKLGGIQKELGYRYGAEEPLTHGKAVAHTGERLCLLKGTGGRAQSSPTPPPAPQQGAATQGHPGPQPRLRTRRSLPGTTHKSPRHGYLR